MSKKTEAVQPLGIAVDTAADQLVSHFQTQLLDRVEDQLSDYFQGSGLLNDLAVRMAPHLTELRGRFMAPMRGTVPGSSLSLGGAIDVEADDI